MVYFANPISPAGDAAAGDPMAPGLLDLYRHLFQRIACRRVPSSVVADWSRNDDGDGRRITDEMLSLLRTISTQIEHARPTIQFIGVEGGEGTSTVSRRFGVVVAGAEAARVLLVDTDECGDASGPPPVPVGAGDTSIEDSMGAIGDGGLYWCRWTDLARTAAGMGNGDPADNIRALIDLLRPLFRLVIVDSGPALKSWGGLHLCRYCDGTMLVIDATRTSGSTASSAIARIRGVGGRLVGAILNREERYGF
jgi:hypothetical protein